MAQLHKRFTDSQVKELIGRYLKGEIRCWYDNRLIGVQTAKNEDLNIVHF